MAQKGIAGLVALSLFVAANAVGDDVRVRNTTPPPYTPRSDVDFIEALVPHHQAALKMAEREVEGGADPEVKAMAQSMIQAQRREIDTMLSVYEDLTGRRRVPPPPPDLHQKRDHAAMQKLSGAELDQAFLEHMIPHHAGAISLSHRALRYLKNQTLLDLAMTTEDSQAAEIGEMERLKQ